MIKPILFAVLLSLGAAPGRAATGHSTAAQDIEAKVALESAVEKRLQAALKKILSTEDLIAIVNVEMRSGADKRNEVEVLPGVLEKETPGVVAALEIPSSLVRRVSVTVILDEGTSEANVQLAKTTAERMIGFNAERGDTVTIGKTRFLTGAAPSLKDKFLDPKWIFSFFWLLVAVAALIMISKRFLDPLFLFLSEAAKSVKAASTSRPGPGGGPVEAELAAKTEALLPLPGAAPAAEQLTSSGRKLPFAFIQERDVPALNLLIRDQPAHLAATIVQYLPPPLASLALGGMPPKTRQQVLAELSKPNLLNEGEVKRWEEFIRSRIDFMMGGEDKLADILDSASVGLQAELLHLLRTQDPALGERLQKRIVVLEDIAQLDEAGLMTLSRHVPVRSLAAAIKSSESIKQQILPKLKTGLGEWLAQEIEFAGDLPADARTAEIGRVLKALSALSKEGKITLHKGRSAEPAPSKFPPPHAAPPPAAAPTPLPQAGGLPPAGPRKP